MDDEPLLTRWNFEDFEFYYDVGFGIKQETKQEEVQESYNIGGASSNGSVNNNRKNDDADFAVFEQFERQGRKAEMQSMVISDRADEVPQKSLIPPFESVEMRSLAETLSRDIIRRNLDVKWESVKGLDTAKRLLKEAVVMPIKYPKYFTGLLSPWKGILLFGPPGTGKVCIMLFLPLNYSYFALTNYLSCHHQHIYFISTTIHPICTDQNFSFYFNIKMYSNNTESTHKGVSYYTSVVRPTMLAKAVATECNTTFFNISASSIVSKWRGDSEKAVKVLFDLARHHAPSTIFLDEIDAIISQRGEARSEHEASRRLKTELLIQMDGLANTDELVFVLAATNLPWELDAAMLRRLEKRILVPLPDPLARRAMFVELLPSTTPNSSDIPYNFLVEKSEGYSGSDIRLVCKEAAMQPLRRLIRVLETRDEQISEDGLPEVGRVTAEDVELALRNTRPSAHLHAHRYEKFNQDYGKP